MSQEIAKNLKKIANLVKNEGKEGENEVGEIH